MANVKKDQRIVTVSVSQAELANLVVDRAKAAGFIDFDPTRINIYESDVETGSFDIIFERDAPV